MKTPITDITSESSTRAAVPAPEAAERRTVIRPRTGWQLVDFGELWRARDLLWMFAVRDIKIQYKQTFFGFAWAIIVPLLQVLVFSVFFGGLLGVADKNDQAMPRPVPYPLFVLTGQLIWNFFSHAVSIAGLSLQKDAAIIRKIYVPRLVPPVSSLAKPALDSLIVSVLMLLVLAWYAVTDSQIWFGPRMLLAIPIFLGTAVPALGIGLILAALTIDYRDLRYVIPFAIQTLFFVTPVIFAGAILQRHEWLLYLNPVAGFVEAFRAAILDLPIDWFGLLLSGFISVIVLGFGLLYFARVERRFADVA